MQRTFRVIHTQKDAMAFTHAAVLALLAFSITLAAGTDSSSGLFPGHTSGLTFNFGSGSNSGENDDNWSGGKHDPVFRGLDGRTFYFDGVVGKIFNIISEQEHQLNAEFGLGPHLIDNLGKKTNGTFMTAIGVQVYQSKIEAHVDEEGIMTVAVNGNATIPLLNEANDFTVAFKEPNGVTIIVERYHAGVGQSVTIATPLMELLLYATPKQFDPEVNQIARGHINFEMGVNPELLQLTEMHGVLGQSDNQHATDTALIPQQLSSAFLGEGKMSDYIVSDLFSTDFIYNLFGSHKTVKAGSIDQAASLKQKSSLKLSASRRHLREGAEIAYHPFAKML